MLACIHQSLCFEILGSRALPYTENNVFLFPCVLWGICPRRRTLGPYTKGRSSFFNMFPHSHKKTNLCVWRFLYWPVFILGNSLEVWEGPVLRSGSYLWVLLRFVKVPVLQSVCTPEFSWGSGRFLYSGVVHTCEFSWGLWRFLYWGVFILPSSLEAREHSLVHSLRWPSPQENPLVQNLAHNIPQENSCQEKKKRRGI